MSPVPASATPDMDKSREELLAELAELRARNAALEKCEARAERLEDIIRNNEDMTRQLLKQEWYGVWVNVGGRVAFVNEVGARILGASSPDEVVGKSLFEFIHPDYHDIVKDRIRAIGRGDSVVPMIEEKYIKVDGQAVDLDVWAMRFTYEGEPAILVAFSDITGKKRAEEELKLTQFALDNFLDSAIWLTQDGSIAYVNREACRSLGYSREELLSMHIWDIDPKFSPEVFRERWPDKRQGLFSKFESTHVTRDGRIFPVDVTSSYTRYGDKEYLITFDRDITERKRVEEALNKNLAELARSQGVVHLGSWTYDCDSETFEVSDEVYRIYGYAPGAVEPTKELLYKRIHPDDLKVFNEYFEAVVLGEWPGVFDYRVVWPDGSVHYLSSMLDSHVRGPDGRVKAVSGITQDITERKRTEEALLSSRQILRDVIENFPGVVFWKDRNSVYMGCNKNFSTAAGLADTGSIVGKTDRDLPWAATEADAYVADDRQVMESGVPKLNIIETQNQAGGRIAWFDTSKVPLLDAGGNVIGVLGASHDITERKQGEEALKEAKMQAELYLDLMGHDINNMNQIAMGYLELAQGTLDYEGRLDRDNAMLLTKPMETLHNASQLIDNVRKLQRERAGLYASARIDLDPLLKDVKDHYSGVPGRDVTIDYEPCTGYTVQANALLKDVFVNLVGNAIKHSNSMKKLAVGIRVKKVREGGVDYCKVSVEDDGPGIPDEMKAKLFDRLSLDATRARGKGFGLCLIKMLVDDYHGKFWAEDRVPGDHTQGARFVVMLPAV